MDRDLADLLAFAEDPQDALARRQPDVVDIEAGDLGDPGAGVEGDERDRSIAGLWPGFDGAKEPDRSMPGQRLGCGLGEVGSRCVGGAEAAAGVQVVDGGQRVVDRGGLPLQHGPQVCVR